MVSHARKSQTCEGTYSVVEQHLTKYQLADSQPTTVVSAQYGLRANARLQCSAIKRHPKARAAALQPDRTIAVLIDKARVDNILGQNQ